jgi:hypothetical protein
MKKRYIIFAIIAIYLVIVLVATVFALKEEPEPEHTPTPTATATETVTPPATATAEKTQCENDRDTIQEALIAYHEDNGDWPTADGKPGDIVWDKLAPEYMPAGVDDQCDWRVSSSPQGQVCVAHTC